MTDNLQLIKYTELRPHSGPRCYGKTPLQTFIDGKKIALEKQIDAYIDFDKMKLDATNEFSLENLLQSVSIAPSKYTANSEMYHGANRVGVESSSYLTDKKIVC